MLRGIWCRVTTVTLLAGTQSINWKAKLSRPSFLEKIIGVANEKFVLAARVNTGSEGLGHWCGSSLLYLAGLLGCFSAMIAPRVGMMGLH